MASNYFSLIMEAIYTFGVYDTVDDFDEDRLKLYYFDTNFIEMFCCWLEEMIDSDEMEEQRKETLRGMICHLKLIWLGDEDEFETWPEKEIRDFDPITFGLEIKMEQSKLQIENWCDKLICSPFMHYCKSSYTDYEKISSFISSVKHNLGNIHRDRAAKTVPFKNQISILKDMVDKMKDMLSHIHGCADSKELVECISFIHTFFNNAACLTCLYWLKEGNDQTVSELNIALFDKLHKIKSCVAHFTPCYIHVLKSKTLLQSNDSVFEGQIPASIVGLFFEHTLLKDDFLILRQPLIVLFTFLTDAPPCENAQEEELIRSQIYALLREDAYLLLPISDSVMKDDFSKGKMLLSNFIINIELLTAKIIEIYCKPSDSWNRSEVEKMNKICFATLQRELSTMQKHDGCSRELSDVLDLYEVEIRFLRSFFLQCFETWDDRDEETRIHMRSVVISLQRIWGNEYDMGLLSGRLYAICKRNKADQEHLLDLELKEKLHMSKKEINAWLVSWFHCSFHCRPSTCKKIVKFLDSILYFMSDIFSSGACKDDDAFNKQTEILEEKLLLVNNFLKLAKNCAYSKNLEDFNTLAQVFANNAACLTYHYWAKEADDEVPIETNQMLSNMLQKIKPNTPVVARMYVGTLKAICSQPFDFFLLEQTATSFVDYFFEDLVTPWKNDFQILRDEVLFYLTFVHHHHHIGNAEEIICRQFDVLFNNGVYDLLPFDDVKGDSFKKKVGLSDLMMNIGTENAKIRQLYCKFPDSFIYNFPKIIGQGFLNCLIKKIKNLTERMINDQKQILIKSKVITIEEELVSMTPIFSQILELTDLNGVLLEVVNMAYLADHIISLCSIFYHLIGYYIPCLSDVIDRIKAVRRKLEKIEECNMYTGRCLPHSTGFKSIVIERDWNSEIPIEMVGFEVDEEKIINNIIRGTESFDIISIVGMGGLGKTTLAKRVYGSSFVRSYFNIYAFTCVSQDYDKRKLLLDLLKDIAGVDEKTSYMMSEDDLAHKLKKCLSRRKYFIVLDDIWNVNAWDKVRSSFPDDLNGSRVMFTTRSLEVAKRCQIKCSPHRLRYLTDEESWKLLKMKIFDNDMPPPPSISSVAKLIAKKCCGLPLSIVVIAGLLARTETSLWAEISKDVGSYLLDEGCMNILELSYKYLPEYLKPGLIYLGAFPEDSSYKARQVTLLWIDEGFIEVSKTKSLNDVAKQYLHELFDRSFIIVDEMTMGEISTFRVHDLIHDFCQKKCRDENFFQLGHGTAVSSFSGPLKCTQYRVSLQKLCEPSVTNTRSLLCFPSKFDNYKRIFPLRKFRFAHVLSLKDIDLKKSDFAHMASLIDLRHVEADVVFGDEDPWIPLSISNLWNLQSLILRAYGKLYVPATLWRMKSLRHVEVRDMKFEVSDEHNAFPQLDKVVSFSRPYLSSGEDVEWLLQRLPAVRELDCILHIEPLDSTEEIVQTFDFHRKLESLSLHIKRTNGPCLINFPSTLIKLTLGGIELSMTTISAIMELQCLRILNLQDVLFPERTWVMEDATFPNLKYIKLDRCEIEKWDADSLPCLEQLYLASTFLEELPPCFGEISSLKKITIMGSRKLVRSALCVLEEQMEYGNKIEFVTS